jgi:hypothetical protein
VLLLLARAAFAQDPDLPAPAPEDVRDTWDVAGHLVRHLVLRGDVRVEETTWRYDDGGRPIERRTEVPGGAVTVEAWAYDPRGHVVDHRVAEDGAERLRETATWDGDRQTSLVVVDPSGTRTTTTTYDDAGRSVLVETRDASGALVARTVADRPPIPAAPVPVTVKLSAGLLTNSDVRESDASLGFEVGMIPKPEQYEAHPLEFRASGAFSRSAFAGAVLTNQTDAAIGADYNDMVGRLTTFLFTRVSRNPAASLDIDLVLAPIGAKYDLVRADAFTLDASLAPVWNFRSIAVEPGATCGDAVADESGHCATSLYRASGRVRAAVTTDRVKLSETVEYLPALNPSDGTLRAALDDQSVFRNTAALTLTVAKALALTESVVFTRDPQLVAQADCDADPTNLLCSGTSLQTTSSLSVTHAF